ncbi:MAG TPA: hypothetical protein VK425_06270 [Acidimicrobiales bacterium]|nr:hypothetical protein [Acidimicrobiales bacterium]
MTRRNAVGDFKDGELAGLAWLGDEQHGELSDGELGDGEISDEQLRDEQLSDAELTALALSADPDAPIAPGAVRLDLFAGQPGCFLPEWYMPRVMAKRARGWRVPAIYAIIAAFLLIDAFGLCITYGQLVVA